MVDKTPLERVRRLYLPFQIPSEPLGIKVLPFAQELSGRLRNSYFLPKFQNQLSLLQPQFAGTSY